MNKRWSVTLLALVTLTFAGTAAATSSPEVEAAPAAEPAVELALPVELAEAPVCTEGTEQIAAVDAAVANPAEAAAGETGWWYGICWTSCMQCTADYQCPWGERCRFGVQCP